VDAKLNDTQSTKVIGSFRGAPLSLDKMMTDKLWLSDAFSKVSEVNLLHQGRQLAVFVANDKVGAFK